MRGDLGLLWNLAVIKLEDVQPATKGHNIIVKVVERKIVLDKRRTNGEGLRIAECLVGDETATALFTARNGTRAPECSRANFV
mmetsp:Transcript_36269/g.145065  ORF Transcript_36269/g.145065 Transcript_36269/m.145065 type:complete len:83 (+) Transcript_36269:626-874(+)